MHEAIHARIVDATDKIIFGVNNNTEFDQFIKGMIRAFYDVLEAEPELLIDDEESTANVPEISQGNIGS